jgi:HK97 gp10 family phage protein
VQPGNLAKGIATKRLKRGAGKAEYEVRWKAKRKGDPFYGLFQEFGTSKQPAQPFMRPAFEATKDQALAAMQARLKRRIDLANKRKA